ncbi:MAG TPA: hypothetical protein VK659_17840 [Asanoa sp.]|nr:hypothetical protein [Asanoa sp.]
MDHPRDEGHPAGPADQERPDEILFGEVAGLRARPPDATCGR